MPIDRPDGKHKPQIEQAADYVAATLLLPLDEVYSYLSENRFQETTPEYLHAISGIFAGSPS